MILKRSLLYSLFFSMTAITNSLYAEDSTPNSQSKSDHEQEVTTTTLEELKLKCLDLREDTQRKPFSIKVNCAGSYTFWESEAGTSSLSNEGTITSQASTKMGRYETPRRVFSIETQDSTAQCKVWHKFKISSPTGVGIPIAITDCDELTPENVGKLCKGEVYDYCENNAAQTGVTQSDDVCNREAVEQFDTCKLEQSQEEQSQKQSQESEKASKEEL